MNAIWYFSNSNDFIVMGKAIYATGGPIKVKCNTDSPSRPLCFVQIDRTDIVLFYCNIPPLKKTLLLSFSVVL